MEKIGIVSDEAMDMPRDLVEKYQIAVVPVKFMWPEIEGLPGDNTFQKMRELEKRGITSFGKTSQPSVNDFLEKFRDQLARFESVICVTLTSKLSGTYNSAIQAKNYLTPEEQKRIFIVDSLSVSGGQALIIFKIIDLINGGKKAEEIVNDLQNFISRCHLSLIVENIKWLEKSGRISHFVATVVSGLSKAGIRPVMSMKEGKLAPTGLKTDAKDIPTALFRQFENDTKELVKNGKKIRVVITHGDDPAGAQRLKEMAEKISQNVEVVFINIINNVVGVVAGPNAITFSWCEA
jgi:uncharacterized protein